jgi:serine-type D-Ala-D-Ala carboxypeptidase/endopeptidase (penicillin-binding protein 4)
VLAATTAAAAGATILTFETVGNPFESPPPRTAVLPAPAATTPAVKVVLAGGDGDETPSADALTDVLDRALADAGLGSRVGAAVADLATGEFLYTRDADVPLTPASTLKLVTAAAALEVFGAEHRFATHVVTGADPGEVILLGGGDPTLATTDPAMSGATSLAGLAEQTALALGDAGVDAARLGFDESLFSGPAVNPHWRPTYVPNGVAAPVSALAVDGGRETPGLAARVADPALATAEAFAELLDEHGIAVDGDPYPTEAAADAVSLAHAESAPLGDIVEYLIASSDNDVAEIVARHVAIGLGRPGAAEEAAVAVTDTLAGLGLDTSTLTVLDGSGLARGSAVPATLLVELLVLAADPARPDLRPVLTGLPVAAFNGTLLERVEAAPGLVRAKTGTLTGVHSLAGFVQADDGTVYAFALLADDADNSLEARAALDAAAAALAECGCATSPAAAG